MKTITITLEDEVYFVCFDLIKQRKLSSTINELLKNFLELQDNDFFQEKDNLEQEKQNLEERMKKVIAKLTMMKSQEQKSKNEARKQALKVLEGLRRNNPLKDKI